MPESTRELLNQIYRPLDEKASRLGMCLSKTHGGFKLSNGFYNGHYHKTAEGECREDKYPIPVISVLGLADIEVDVDGLTVTAKLSKKQIAGLDWKPFESAHFEVYGVENYLCDYGNESAIDGLGDRIRRSAEKEFFVSFSFPAGTGDEELLTFLRILQKYGFYY